MSVNGIGSIASLYATQSAEAQAQTKKEEEESSLPVSWGEDTVSFSPEAMAALKAVQTDDDGESDAKDQFSEYMDKATGKDGGSASSPEEHVAKLKEKLEKLSSEIAKVAADTSMPEETKNSRMQTLQGEMNQVVAQIAELEASIAETEA